MKDLKNTEAIAVASLVDQSWLTQYPWPSEIIFDRGIELMGQFAQIS